MNRISLERMLSGFFNHDSEYAILVLDPAFRVLLCNGGAQSLFGYARDALVGRRCPFDIARHGGLSENVLLGGTMAEEHKGYWSYDTILADASGRTFPAHVSVISCSPRDADCARAFPAQPANDAPTADLANQAGEHHNEHHVDHHEAHDGGHHNDHHDAHDGEHLLVIIKDTSVEVAQDRLRNIIIEVAHLANQPKELIPMLDDIMHVLRTSLDIPLAFVCLTEDGRAFRVTSASGLTPAAQDEHCHAGSGANEPRAAGCMEACTELTISHEPLLSHRISDLLPDVGALHEPFKLIHVPLLSDVAVLGVLHVAIPLRLLRTYIQDSQVLSLIANKLAASIRNKQFEKELHDYAADLERAVQQRTDQLREKDAQLVQSGKLATLGEMATGIAHEINQPLGGISLMAQGIQRALEKGKLTDELLANRLHSIHEQIERINKIINHLRVFGRQAPESKSPIDVNKPLRDVLDLIGMQLRNHNILLTLTLDERLPHVLGDANRLEQVFLNIIGNARDALEEQEIRVNGLRAELETPDWAATWEKQLSIRTAMENGMVTITVTDTAGGIPERVMSKIFEPFFTTKQVGKGTGLGLSISYGIVKEFDGDLRVTTKMDVGSTFTVALPPIENERNSHSDEPADGATQGVAASDKGVQGRNTHNGEPAHE